jgi:hypothetical protein
MPTVDEDMLNHMKSNFTPHYSSLPFTLTTNTTLPELMQFRRRLIRVSRRAEMVRVDNILNSITPSNKSFYPFLHTVIGSRPSSSIAYVKDADGNDIHDPQGVCDSIASHFATAATPIAPCPGAVDRMKSIAASSPSHTPPLWVPPPDDWCTDDMPDVTSDMSAPFTTGQLRAAASQLKHHSACGDDGVPLRLLATYCNDPVFSKACVALFNDVLRTRTTPAQWSHAFWTAIPKGGLPSHILTNLRPISLGQGIGKLFELCIKDRLCMYLESNKLFYNLQCGFRPKYSTLHSYILLNDVVALRKLHNIGTRILLVDIEKAFDTVFINGLLFKLHMLGVDSTIVCLIGSLLSHMVRYAVHMNCKSTLYDILAGVSQGSVLGPILYIVFINDIVAFFAARGRHINIPYAEILLACLLFADDLSLLCVLDTVVTQQYIDDMLLYAAAHRFRINVRKTIALDMPYVDVVPGSQDRFFCMPPLGPNNTYLPVQHAVPVVDCAKFLGIPMGKDCWLKHLRNGITACNLKLIPFYNAIFSRRVSFCPASIHRVISPLCFSHLDFGHQAVFPYYTKDNLNEANVYHRRVIRNILGLHERSGSGIVITNKHTKKKQVIFPSANVIIYLDFLFSPMEYRWLVNALDFYNSFVMLSQSNDTMRTILRACVRYDTGWIGQLGNAVRKYELEGVDLDGATPISMETVRVYLRLYWWKWLRKEINSRPHLAYLLSTLPTPDAKLPWEEHTTSPPCYLHHSFFLHCPDAVRACISVRSGFLLVKCRCGIALPSMKHTLWSCPTLHALKLPLIASHAPTVLDENNAIDVIMDTLVHGGPSLLCTFYFVYKAYYHQANV